MTFKPEAIKDFLIVFERSKEKIRDFEGCRHLELLRDYHHDNLLTTYSHWDDEDALNNYRSSALFKEVWEETRNMFAEKAVVFSMKKFIEVG